MKDGSSTQHDIIPHLDIPGQQAVIGNDGAISDAAVVSQMDSSHQHVVIAHPRRRAFGGSSVDRDIFPDDIVVSDDHLTYHGVVVGEILRCGTDHGAVTNEISISEGDPIRQDDARLDGAVIPNANPFLNNGKGADNNIFSKDGLGAHKCGGMNGQSVSPKAFAELLAA